MLTRQLNFNVQRLTVTDPVAPNIGLSVVAYVHDSAVLGVELAYRVVPSDAAIFTESYDNLVL